MPIPVTVEEFCDFHRTPVRNIIIDRVRQSVHSDRKAVHITMKLGYTPYEASDSDEARKAFMRAVEAMIQEVILDTLPGNTSVPVYGWWTKETSHGSGQRQMDEPNFGNRYEVTFTVWRFAP